MERLRRRKTYSLLLQSALLTGIVPVVSYAPALYAQSSPALRALLDRAKLQAAHGHPEIAVQTWEQVLLSDPGNREALTALAKFDMQLGRTEEARGYLGRLKALSGDNPDVQAIEKMPTVASRDARLDVAVRAARAGDYAGAAHIYQQVFGDNPPPGNWALAYYDTEAALPDRRQHAVDGLRQLAQQFPAEARYSITLGRILTYDAKTRAQGIALLGHYPDSRQAQDALHQAQHWNAITQAPVQAPVQPQLAAADPSAAPVPHRPVADSKDAAAYRALNGGRLDEAERLFRGILADAPKSASALSGMGYVRLKQHQFTEAQDYLAKAQAAGAKGRGFEDALGLSRFWTVMSRAADEQKAGQLAQALADYRSAQQMRPGSPEAAEGAAGVLMQQGDGGNAAALYQQAVHGSAAGSAGQFEAWRGLVLANSASGNDQAAMDEAARTPSALEEKLERDPAYLAALYRSAKATGNTAQATTLLNQVLALPFPNRGRDLPISRQMEYANLLAAAQKYNASLALYRQIVAQDPENQEAWRAMIAAEHSMGNDDEALTLVRQIPSATLTLLESRSDFLALIGSLYVGLGDPAEARKYLSRALSMGSAQPTDQSGVMLQLAGLNEQQGDLDAAYRLYERVLASRPQDASAWIGEINTLHLAHRDHQALEKVASISPETRLRLDGDPGFEQVLASVEAGAGDTRAAMGIFERLDQSYAERQQTMPLGTQIQYGWLLNRQGDDRRLYPLVQRLAAAPDMTPAEQNNFRALVAAFTMRRGTVDLAAGRTARGLGLLEAAHRTFPNNSDVSDALAGAYQRIGQPRQALTLYQSSSMDNATLPQYRGAISAALSAGDTRDAAEWLQIALSRYATDPALLRQAAQYEMARGDNRKAAAYYKAALQMMGNDGLSGGLNGSAGSQASGASLLQLLAPESPAPSRGNGLPGLPQQNLDEPPAGQNPVEGQPGRMGVPQTRTLGDLLGLSADPPSSGGQAQGEQLAQLDLPSGPATQAQDTNLTSSEDSLPSADAPSDGNRLASALDPSNDELDAAPADHSAAVDNLSFAPQSAPDSQPHAIRRLHVPAAQPLDDIDPLPSAEGSSLAGLPDTTGSDMAAKATPDSQQLEAAAPESDAIPDSFAPVTEPRDALPLRLRNASLNVSPQQVDSADDGSQLASAATQLKQTRRSHSHHGRTLQTLPALTPGTSTGTMAGRAPDPSLTSPQYGTGSAPAAADLAQQTPAVPDNAISNGPGLSTGSGFVASLPPLTGSFRNNAATPLTPREQVQEQLELIESGSSGWLGGTSSIDYRSGQPGLDKLSIYSAQIESSAMLGPDVRLSVVTKPVLLDAGTPTGAATLQQGTLALTATPETQSASGVGGELQLRASSFGASIGYTPYNFLVSNAIGSILVAPAGGHVSLSLSRSAVQDTQLSYAGLRDTGSQGPLYSGNVWGGVVTNAGELQVSSGNAQQGWYIEGGGQYLTGYHVPDNTRADGDAGAYWRVWHDPSWGTVTVGANFFGMHYAKNLRYFTYGQGGYFSPSAYLLGNVPVTVSGHYGNRFHYQVIGSLGVQAFSESSSAYFPLDLATQIAQGNPYYPERTSVGSNYDLQSEGAYAISDHWYVGGYLNANNSRDYATARGGFYVRYLFRPQPALGDRGPTGLFPMQGLRPLRVP